MIAACFVLVGGTVFIIAADVTIGTIFLSFSVAAATMLLAAIGTVSGATWAIAVEFTAVASFGASTVLLFLAFPVNRLNSRIGWVLTAGFVGMHMALIGLFHWVVAFNPAAYDVLKGVLFSTLTADLMGASTLMLIAFFSMPSRRSEARRALGLVAMGAITGVAPFCLFSLGPYLLGFGYLLPAELAILSVVLLPVSLGAAVLSRQFLGINRIVRRGLIALLVWMVLLVGYSLGLDVLRLRVGGGQEALALVLGSTALSVAIVAGTFPIVQGRLRRWLERLLFRDVYEYTETLQRISTEIVGLSTVEATATHVLARLGQTLDLSWAAIALKGEPAPLVFRWGSCPGELDPRLLVADGAPAAHHPDSRLAGQLGTLIPLVADGVNIGTVAVGPKRHDVDLLADDVSLLATLAPLIATALTNGLLVRRLEAQIALLGERERALEALSAKLMHAQEEERRRIALDLHDDPLQRAILLAREISDRPDHPTMQRWRWAAEEIIASLRAICAGLRPPTLDDFGLAPALEWLVNDLRARSDLAVSLVVEGPGQMPFGRLEAELETELYRVAQEAMNNCLKHARATQVVLTLARDGRRVWLSVVDDGQGYQPAGADAPTWRHLGILGMQERVRPWQGAVTVGPGPAGGTIVTAEIPGQSEDDRESYSPTDPGGRRRRPSHAA